MIGYCAKGEGGKGGVDGEGVKRMWEIRPSGEACGRGEGVSKGRGFRG